MLGDWMSGASHVFLGYQQHEREQRSPSAGLRIARPMKTTRRQSEILVLAATGLTDKEIANELNVSYRTVRTYLERLYGQSGVHGRTAVVARWLADLDHVDVGRPRG